MSISISLLEDDAIIAEQMQFFLHAKGHKVERFENGEEFLENKKLHEFDIFLLDIDTPKINGLEALGYIREMHINTPVIMVTAKSSIDFVKKGYALGCNDYLKKPFDLEELELRMQALVPSKNRIKLSLNLYFDTNEKLLYQNETRVQLGQKELALLDVLVKNKNRVVPNSDLRWQVWEDRDVSEGTIRSSMRFLREKMGCDIIKNIRGAGYMLEV